MSLNKVILQGRLVADPELRQTSNEVQVASFRIAVDRDFKNKETGQREADFINVTAWRSAASFVCQYFQKGSMILISGHLQTRQYTDKDGNNRHATDVVAENVYFCGSKSEGGATRETGTQAAYQPQTAPNMNFVDIEVSDDELPF